MEPVLEVLFELFGELFLQVVVELLFAAGFRAIANTLKGEAHPAVSVFVYAAFGTVFGLVTVLAFPTSFLHRPELRFANLVVAPLVAGGIMGVIGGYRKKRERFTVRIDSFGFAYVFALTFAAMRFYFTK